MKNKIPKYFLILAFLHFASIAYVSFSISSRPTHDLKLAFFSDGALVFGKNKFNKTAVAYLSEWDSLISYLSNHSLYIAEKGHLAQSNPGSYFAPTQISLKANSDFVSVIWSTQHTQNNFGLLYVRSQPFVIHAPDMNSAKLVARALKNGDVYPSNFGFALKLENL